MSRFLYFGSVFAARFGAGKDLRITDSSQAGKAVWVAAEGKLISPSPYYLQFSPSFLTGEGLASGKIVAMDGGRYRCRLPILGPDWPQSPDLGLFKRLNGDRGEKDSLRFYAKSSLRSDDLVPVIIWPGPLDDRHIQVGAANSLATDRYLPRDFGFLPVLEPILDYAPEGARGPEGMRHDAGGHPAREAGLPHPLRTGHGGLPRGIPRGGGCLRRLGKMARRRARHAGQGIHAEPVPTGQARSLIQREVGEGGVSRRVPPMPTGAPVPTQDEICAWAHAGLGAYRFPQQRSSVGPGRPGRVVREPGPKSLLCTFLRIQEPGASPSFKLKEAWPSILAFGQ